VWRRLTIWGVVAGIAVGLVLAIVFANVTSLAWGINPGFAALGANVVVTIVVSLLTYKEKEPAIASSSPSTPPSGLRSG
jgi:Na+/proline symporter